MLQRHKVPTIFNIYMLDVICCALGCVILLWQVAHQEASEQTEAAKTSQADAVKQSAAALQARAEYELAQRKLETALKDVTLLQADVTDWRGKNEKLAQALLMTEKERENARRLAALRLLELSKSQSSLALSEEQLKKLETDLTKLLAEYKSTSAD